MMAKERSDLSDLVCAATKASFYTRSPDGVERCVDVLNQLNSLSLSVKDILLSESIFKLETLKKHRNPRIRKEAQDLFDSWHKTLKAKAGNNSFKVGLTKLRLKLKKPLLSSLIDEGVMIKKTTSFIKLKKREDERSLTHDDEKIGKKTYFLEPKNKHDEKERKTNLKPLSFKKTSVACEAVTMKHTEDEHHKMCSVPTLTAYPERSRQNIKDKDRLVSTRNMSSVVRRDDESCKKKQETKAAKDSENPKSAALKTKAEDESTKKKTEFLELFKVAKKAADLANAKGIRLGKAEASRCVEALSLLMRINISLSPKDLSQMMEKLDRLTNHKDRKICNAASALLHLLRQRITDQQRIHSATNKVL